MLVDLYGKLIREQRARRGLTQEALAGKARVSRAILSRLEQCKPVPVQSDTIDRLLAALEVQPALDAAGRDAGRRLARLEQEVKRREQRERHLRLALELSADGAAAKAKVAKARERVALWREKKSCSPFYIERWSKLLAKPPRVLAREMSSLGEWEDALFQNTPFDFGTKSRSGRTSRTEIDAISPQFVDWIRDGLNRGLLSASADGDAQRSSVEFDVKELVGRITRGNTHGEVSVGKRVGKEAL